MFRPKRNRRTYNHHKNIAALLSFIAGIVNVMGIVSIQELTTNVTGHFGYFVEELFKLDYRGALIYFLYVLFFFLGSFSSNILIEVISKFSDRFIYVVPAILESFILLILGIAGAKLASITPNVIAFSLLFAMGFQNALVTIISNAIVRTTHLTGLFTDLGIEVSQLFFYSSVKHKKKLKRTINLRLRIITFFFLGGLCGGWMYSQIGFHVLFLPVTLLFFGIFYDAIKYQMILLRRRKRLISFSWFSSQ